MTTTGAVITGIILGAIPAFWLGFCVAHWLENEWRGSDDPTAALAEADAEPRRRPPRP